MANTKINNKTIIAKVNLNLDIIKENASKIFEGKKGKYLDVTFVINNEIDQFGNNGPVYVSQSKEEREAGEPKSYMGNTKVVAVFDDGFAPKSNDDSDDVTTEELW